MGNFVDAHRSLGFVFEYQMSIYKVGGSLSSPPFGLFPQMIQTELVETNPGPGPSSSNYG